MRNAGAAENRRRFAHDDTAHRAGWARRKVLSEREYVSAADSLRGLERANRDLESMTRREGQGVNEVATFISENCRVLPSSHGRHRCDKGKHYI